jgi:hypothetical protein
MAMVQRSWSPDRLLPGAPACTMLNEAGMVTFNRVWTGRTEPSRRPGAQFAPIDLRPAANRSLRDDAPGDGKGWADLGPNYDLRALKPGRRVLAGAPFDILDGDRACVMVHNRLFFNRELPSRVEIPVGRQAASIVFLHSLDSRAGQNYHQKRELAGYYFMVYDDGTYHPMEIKYGINAANFDGLVTYWDYSPRGDTMEKAALAWRGQMGCGIEAALYRAEWVNPFPAKKIERILFASSWKPCAFNPILVAATAVLPTPQDIENPPKPAETWDVPGKVRRVESLSPPEPKGRPMDLTNGECETDTRWRARDGIVVEFDGEPANATKLAYALIPFWTRIPCALYDNAEFLRPKDGGKPLTITLPQPRRLAGVLFLAAYRHEKDNTDADHRPSRCNYEVAFSPDGTAWTTVATRSLYVAEEDGPQWVPLPDQPVKAVRINMTGGGKFAFVQPYEPTDATPPGRP